MNPMPKSLNFKGTIIKDNSNKNFLYPKYYLYIQHKNEHKFLIAAKK